MDRLPEELILHVFDHLDKVTAAPSILRDRDEPTITLTESPHKALKQSSLVCRKWRRLVLPLLFRNTQLRLDGIGTLSKTCKLCSADAIHSRFSVGERFTDLTAEIDVSQVGTGKQHQHMGGETDKLHGCVGESDQYHADMIDDFVRHLKETTQASKLAPSHLVIDQRFDNFTTWIPRFYHNLTAFLDFVYEHDLSRQIESFLLMTEPMLPEKLDRFPHRAASNRDWRYRAVAAFWEHILRCINPRRIAILASPADLSCLTLSAMDTFGDWAFGDMEYHLLTFEHDYAVTPAPLDPIDYYNLSYDPINFPGVATSSIFFQRPWKSLHLNEGSFLKAYGTYEYFERGPPSVIHSIHPDMWLVNSSVQHKVPTEFGMKHVKRLVYTSMFPFAGHTEFNDLLEQLEVLDLQLAPAPSSNILNDKSRVGKAELMDCWSELLQTYQAIVGRLATFRITARNTPFLKQLICRDHCIKELRDELDDVFIPLCLPVWAEFNPGVFHRIAPDANLVYILN